MSDSMQWAVIGAAGARCTHAQETSVVGASPASDTTPRDWEGCPLDWAVAAHGDLHRH